MKQNEMGIADKLNSVTKFVVSSTLDQSMWENTTFIHGNLIDEIRLLIHPVIIGSGEKFFNEQMTYRLALTKADVIENGVIKCIYKPDYNN